MQKQNESEVLDLFRRQSGVISRRQAVALGFSERQIDYRVGTGAWLRVQRGVYRHPLFEVGPETRVWTLVLGGAFVSHRYAARLHGLEPELQALPEVTVPSGRHLEFPGIRIHGSRQIETADLCDVGGLPVSGVERTIMDVAAVEPRRWWVLALIDSAKQQGLTDSNRLISCLDRHARRGRDGTVRFRDALEHPTADAKTAIGHQSRKVAGLFEASGLPYPFFEERVFDGDQFIAQVDLSFSLPMVGFIDGYRHHKARVQTNRDRWQRQRLREMGLLVVEFTADQTARNPGYVKTSAVATYREAERLVRLSPQRYRWWTERTLARRSSQH